MRTVTGSKHVLRTSRATVLLECGLFQGHRDEANRLNRALPVDATKLDAVVAQTALTRALTERGFVRVTTPAAGDHARLAG